MIKNLWKYCQGANAIGLKASILTISEVVPLMKVAGVVFLDFVNPVENVF